MQGVGSVDLVRVQGVGTWSGFKVWECGQGSRCHLVGLGEFVLEPRVVVRIQGVGNVDVVRVQGVGSVDVVRVQGVTSLAFSSSSLSLAFSRFNESRSASRSCRVSACVGGRLLNSFDRIRRFD